MTISKRKAEELLKRFHRQRILVVGDLMLDRYIYGSVSRISPEAPVPVVHVQRERSMPGGACNVASNIRSLGGHAAVAGYFGVDRAGEELKRLLKREQISTAACVDSRSVCTTVKTRIIAERQQVVRVDWETPGSVTARSREKLIENVRSAVRQATGVVLEDYGKGVICQEIVDAVLEEAKGRGIPVGLDPKENHELRVEGITVGTPNRKEAFTMAGMVETKPHENPLRDKALRRVAEILMEKWRPQILMITLGPQGMLLVTDSTVRHVPTRAREVFDVSGAGDTVIATCVLALSAGASPLEAAELSNYAAGVVVGKIGTATCTPNELLAYIP